jgi:hypothetical protein
MALGTHTFVRYSEIFEDEDGLPDVAFANVT